MLNQAVPTLLLAAAFAAHAQSFTVNCASDQGPFLRRGQGYLYSWWHTRESPMHGNPDLFRDNVLWHGERIGGVIDFYFAGCSLWLYDLAVTVNDWCVELATAKFDPARVQALLDAYHAVRPLTDLEHQCWRTVLRAAALRFWISRLYDLHLPREALSLTPHDPTRFQTTLRQRKVDATLPWPR